MFMKSTPDLIDSVLIFFTFQQTCHFHVFFGHGAEAGWPSGIIDLRVIVTLHVEAPPPHHCPPALLLWIPLSTGSRDPLSCTACMLGKCHVIVPRPRATVHSNTQLLLGDGVLHTSNTSFSGKPAFSFGVHPKLKHETFGLITQSSLLVCDQKMCENHRFKSVVRTKECWPTK